MYRKRNDVLVLLGLYLGGYGREFYLREIAKRAKIPLRTTQMCVGRLERENVLKSSVRGRHKYFRLNLDDVQTKFYLLEAELYKTMRFLKRYPLFKMFLKEITSDTPILVFGSFARFSADKRSDVDLLVLSKEELPEHALAHAIHKVELSKSAFVKSIEKQEALMKEIEEDHVILNNHSFYVNAMWRHYGK